MQAPTVALPTIAWSHLLSSAHGPRRKHDIKLSIKTGETKGFSIELHGAETHKVCSCKKCALWMFAAYTCPCCGARERQLFGNGQSPEKSQKRFQEKYGLLKAVEAGEDVRNIGRIELAFQNGDVLSVGVNCQEKNDGEYFRSIIEAFRGTAGLIMCKEMRCRARRCKSIGKPEGETGISASLGSGDEAADAERHMQELLAMEVESSKRGLTSSSRRTQRKSKPSSNAVKTKVKDVVEMPEILSHEDLIQTDPSAICEEQSISCTEPQSEQSPEDEDDDWKDSIATAWLEEDDPESDTPGWLTVKKSSGRRSIIALARTRPDEDSAKTDFQSCGSTCVLAKEVVTVPERSVRSEERSVRSEGSSLADTHQELSSQESLSDEICLPPEPSRHKHLADISLESSATELPLDGMLLSPDEVLQRQHSPIGTPVQTLHSLGSPPSLIAPLPRSVGPPPSYPAPPPPPPALPAPKRNKIPAAVAQIIRSSDSVFDIPLGSLLPTTDHQFISHSNSSPRSGERGETWNPWQNKLFFCKDDSPYTVSTCDEYSLPGDEYLHGHVLDVALGPLLCK
mmetsp:Transcript_105727/g.164984  ORF Transcript_105727/g.164984 Transcript_105727/m.164984 type:complete len:568 (+) Transcript_105727:57-1760(+)